MSHSNHAIVIQGINGAIFGLEAVCYVWDHLFGAYSKFSEN